MKIDGIEYTDEEVVQAAELYPYTWVLQNNIKNEVGVPIEFEKRKFLKDIYNDLSPLQVLLKPPQIGATVCHTLKSLYVAKKYNRQIIYTLPTQGDVQQMVGGSINRIIAQNPVLMSWVKDHDTVEQKQVGNSMIFYRGTWSAKQAMMIPSGLNIHDEVDASDPDVIIQYETRLQAQEDGGWRWYYSHPSLAGHGVDVYWEQSDKKEFHITCPSCLEHYDLQWPRNISIEKQVYICHLCNHTLSNTDRINGGWYNQDGIKWTGIIVGNYTFSGWHVSQPMLYNKSAKEIIDAFNDPMKDKQYFYNYVLGLPYTGSEDTISSNTVLKNVVSEVNDQEGKIVIGVDTGLPIHYVIGNQQGVFYYGQCKPPSEKYDPYDELEGYLKRWPKSTIVSDQGGDLIGIRKLQAKYPGRVILCFYQKDKKSNDVIRWGKDKEYGTVRVDRNRMIQLIVEQLRDLGRIRLNGDVEDWKEFASHFDNIYREKILIKETKDKDDRSLYGNEFVWKRNGPDHFVHSTVYWSVGMEKYGQSMATIIGDSPFGNLPVGRITNQSNENFIRAEGVVDF